jgi:hypothetical protein
MMWRCPELSLGWLMRIRIFDGHLRTGARVFGGLLSILLPACGSSAQNTPYAGEGGRGGSTNMPDLLIVPEGGEVRDEANEVVGDGPEWLKVISNHYVVSSELPLETAWLALVVNVGPASVCDAWTRPTFFDQNRNELGKLLGGSVYAPLYERGDGEDPHMCLAPGEFAIAAAFAYPKEPLDPDLVAEVGYSLSGRTYPDLVRSQRVTAGDLVLDDGVVRGTLTNSEDMLFSWLVVAFGTVNGGLPVAVQAFKESSGVPAGHGLEFELPPFSVPVTGFEVFVDYTAP